MVKEHIFHSTSRKKYQKIYYTTWCQWLTTAYAFLDRCVLTVEEKDKHAK